ncbi:MAG: DUF433 domain-containing protein [Rhodocyclaceae bacterium]|nr:DUF433 domain-containing protein [Rhodocyclaceae bacterium]
MKRSDPREAPNYTIPEAAGFLGMRTATLRYWVTGRANLPGVIIAADQKNSRLSFFNLVEAHVLGSLRRDHRITFPRIRRAIDFTAKRMGVKRPLLQQTFETDGMDIFVRELERLINASRDGQLAIREVIGLYLRRVDRDPAGVPIKLHPVISSQVVIDPQISFGRPTLLGTGVPIEEISDRFRAGDAAQDIAEDYGLQVEQVDEAIRCQLLAA